VTSPPSPPRVGVPARKPRRSIALAAGLALAAIAVAGLLWREMPGAGDYFVEAAFYRATGDGEERLDADARLTPGDELFLKMQGSIPLHVYVVDEDEKGEAYLLFPLPAQPLDNPLPAGETLTLPGSTRWIVTTEGEREHFLVFASPEPVPSLEQAFASLSVPKEGAPIGSNRLGRETLERLRGVGGLGGVVAASAERREPSFSRVFTEPLTNIRERTSGLWVRQLTVENPLR
jgi:hypothetical protein